LTQDEAETAAGVAEAKMGNERAGARIEAQAKAADAEDREAALRDATDKAAAGKNGEKTAPDLARQAAPTTDLEARPLDLKS